MALTDEDKKLRMTGIGGSDIGPICGLSKYRSAIAVFREKRGDGDGFEGNNATEWGERLEPVVALAYAEKHGVTLAGPFASWRSGVAEWHIVSIDRVVVDPALEYTGIPPIAAILRLIEIKTAGWYGGREFGDDGSDDLPLTYLAQVAWYQALGIQHATVPALINTSDYREFNVERDPELEGYLLERAERFWRLVKANKPPEPDGSDSFKKYLQQRFRRTTEMIRDSSPDVDELTWKLRQVKILQREIEKRAKLIEQQMQNVIGVDDGIETEHGKVTFKFDRRGRTNWKKIAINLHKQIVDAEPSAPQLEDYVGNFRDRPGRRFLTPRAWLKDELSQNITDLLEGKHDDETNEHDTERSTGDASAAEIP